MVSDTGYLTRFLDKAKEPKNYRWLVPLLVLIILFFSVRSCLNRGKQAQGVYRIARDATWYPLDFFGRERNILGFADDLVFNIAKRKSLRIQMETAAPGDLLESLDDGADGILTSITPDTVLQDTYLFSEPFYRLGAVLVVDTQSPILSLKDMEGKFLGIKRASTVLFNIPGHPNVRVVTYDGVIPMLEDVVKDKIDGALLNQMNAYNFTTGYYKGKLRVATPPLTQEGLRLVTGTSNRDTVLMSAFNEGLAEMKKDGTYHALLLKWDLHDPTFEKEGNLSETSRDIVGNSHL